MNLEKILGIKYPIIQGGMARIATGEFAAKVSNLGAMGLIATGGLTVEKIREEIEKCKSLTDKNFGLNIMLLHPNVEKIAELVVDYNIKFVTTGAGNPGKFMKKWKDNGAKVFPVVANKSLAIRMQRAGADGLIAEGTEAGGHIGELTSMVLLNQLREAVDIPIVAAGGISSGRQVLAAEALGASGVQLGTILLASEECPIHDNYKNKLISAKSNNVTVIGRISGYPTRVLKNDMTKKYIELEKKTKDIEELELMTLGALKRAVEDGDVKEGSLMCGQVVESIKEIRPLEEILKNLMDDYKEEKRKLCQS